MDMTLVVKQPALYFTMAQWNKGLDCEGTRIEAGSEVEYECHLPGGMLKVQYKGESIVIHPGITDIG